MSDNAPAKVVALSENIKNCIKKLSICVYKNPPIVTMVLASRTQAPRPSVAPGPSASNGTW